MLPALAFGEDTSVIVRKFNILGLCKGLIISNVLLFKILIYIIYNRIKEQQLTILIHLNRK